MNIRRSDGKQTARGTHPGRWLIYRRQCSPRRHAAFTSGCHIEVMSWRRLKARLPALYVEALDSLWAAEEINHASGRGWNAGLRALHAYHEQATTHFGAFSDVRIEILHQIAQGDRVITHLHTRARHTADFAGVPATGRGVTLATIRIDRLDNDKITEQWTITDADGILHQLQD